MALHPRLHAFARHWGFRIRACAPYRSRTKGKDERGVGYVKRNAIAGRCFVTSPEMEAHLEAWTREIADVRVHGTTGETPHKRFERHEAGALRSPAGIPPFMTARDLLRRVGADCAIKVDGNAYSVPWRLIGERGARDRRVWVGRCGCCMPVVRSPCMLNSRDGMADRRMICASPGLPERRPARSAP